MDAGTLARAMGQALPLSQYALLTPAFNAAMLAAGCTTVERAAMWCAQLGHESVGLRFMVELWGPTSDQYTYDGRMGNGPGEGYRYRGRGAIQLTGKNNYRACSQWAFERGLVPTPTFFVDDPDAAADLTYGFVGAVWYWTAARPMNSFADRRDLEGATRAVNGGFNGLDDRRRRWNLCLALGEALLPTEGDGMSAADDELTKRFPSRSKYRSYGRDGEEILVDTAVGFILNIDARIHEEHVEREARNGAPWAIALVRREATKTDPVDEGARALLAQIEGAKK